MEIEVQLTNDPIAGIIPPPSPGVAGAWVEFRGIVRDAEEGRKISALEYNAYTEMAHSEMRRLVTEISQQHQCLAVKIIHRVGVIAVGETAIYIGAAAKHRAEALAMVTIFMDRLKQDVPIWKVRALPLEPSSPVAPAARVSQVLSMEQAMSKISSSLKPLPPVRVSLSDAFGRVLRETVHASEDFPPRDLSTRDGYAILDADQSDAFEVIDVLHAADWKPRQLLPGQAVHIATGAALPSANMRVIMQENVVRNGTRFTRIKPDASANVRRRGEDARAGDSLLPAGIWLGPGPVALLASAGLTHPLVSPRLRVMHFTTGDEIVSPQASLKPGQVRDSNSFLVRGLLQQYQVDLTHKHLSENFQKAKTEVEECKALVSAADLLLISGGASVGEKDFTRALLEWLGFEIVFSQVDVRPGRPLIFGKSGDKAAFGLPGNPLSHFACFHFAVAPALSALLGTPPVDFSRTSLASPLQNSVCPRETLWPARLDQSFGLHPLPWSSSGDVSACASATALLRVPPNTSSLTVGMEVDFLPTGGNFVYGNSAQ